MARLPPTACLSPSISSWLSRYLLQSCLGRPTDREPFSSVPLDQIVNPGLLGGALTNAEHLDGLFEVRSNANVNLPRRGCALHAVLQIARRSGTLLDCYQSTKLASPVGLGAGHSGRIAIRPSHQLAFCLDFNQTSILKRTRLRAACLPSARCVCCCGACFASCTGGAPTRRSRSPQCFSWKRSMPTRPAAARAYTRQSSASLRSRIFCHSCRR